ncbi:putative aldouronate transport system permease protein [Paenibacillus sp. 1_12]|uniref:carbohydrate ABC transporter permease n=1 Tax=Paenibacillus sp. 1_12 TaxID=1566278 RepID=UPI0008EDC590|nr:carbohydrate ABC transporter permease [Paenibacillus sp. 1_12]SFL26172.1 putative aldouronate transport system permease protein [Paenibacillus sp. 1_12]
MKDTMGEKWFYAFNYLILFIIGLSCLLPLVHLFALSLSDNAAIVSGIVTLWPIGWNVESYNKLFFGTRIMSGFQNSFLITIVGTILNMIFTICCAYPLSRKFMYGRKFFTLGIIFTMLFSGGLIPSYLVVKSLGLIDTYGALWLPALVSVYNMLVMRSFFMGLPEEIEEAARMDGCSEMGLLMRIILPLSMPVMAALVLFYAVSHWNSFFNVMIYINSTAKYNVAVLVQQMIQSQTVLQDVANQSPEDLNSVTEESIKAAGVFVMTVPMLIVYPFLQKYFVKGVLIGSVKG